MVEEASREWDPPVPAAIWRSDNSERSLTKLEGPIEVPPQTSVTLRAEVAD